MKLLCRNEIKQVAHETPYELFDYDLSYDIDICKFKWIIL